MPDIRFQKSRKLSSLDINAPRDNLDFHSYWCRIAFSKHDRWNLKQHSHSFFELQLCLKGQCLFDVSGKKYLITPEKYILLPPDKKHTIIKASDDFEKFIWGFKIHNNRVSMGLASSCLKAEPSRANTKILDAVEIIMDNADSTEFEACGIIKAQLYYILCMLVRDSASISDGERSIKSSSLEAKEIMSFIKGNLSASMSVSDIAAQFYMSARQITRICEKEFGVTLKELETSLRLEKIRQLLSGERISLDEIAKQTGFADGYSMSKFFKKHEGMPPGKYRYSLKE